MNFGALLDQALHRSDAQPPAPLPGLPKSQAAPIDVASLQARAIATRVAHLKAISALAAFVGKSKGLTGAALAVEMKRALNAEVDAMTRIVKHE